MSDHVLVTGGAGFIGSHLVAELSKRHYVVALDDLSGGYIPNLVASGATHKFVPASTLDNLDDLFAEHKFKYVYHLAAYAAEGMSHFIRRYNYTNNLIGSVNLINASIRHKVKCFVFTSSMAVYGRAQSPLLESTPCRPADPYGVAKLAVEHDLEAARWSHGLPYVVLRLHNVYGERQNLHDPFRNVVAIFMRRALRGLPLPVFGDGSQVRQFTYVRDIVPMIAACPWVAEARGQVINLGSSTRCNILTLAELVQQACAPSVGIEFLPARHEVNEAYASHALQHSLLGSCNTALYDGLARMAAWARTQPLADIERPLPFKVELTDGMPPSWRRRAGVGAEVEEGVAGE